MSVSPKIIVLLLLENSLSWLWSHVFFACGSIMSSASLSRDMKLFLQGSFLKSLVDFSFPFWQYLPVAGVCLTFAWQQTLCKHFLLAPWPWLWFFPIPHFRSPAFPTQSVITADNQALFASYSSIFISLLSSWLIKTFSKKKLCCGLWITVYLCCMECKG